METAVSTLLAGRLRYEQPVDGYRTGIEPVLLAASVPAQAGERVIEAGTGAGAGLMCLAQRVPGIGGIGVELDPAMADLARANVAANGLAGLSAVTGDIAAVTLPPADHAMANPPWHDHRSTASPLERRRRAKQESAAGLEAWIMAMGRMVRAGGTVTMIVPALLVPRWTAAAMTAGLRTTLEHRLLPKPGRAAKLVIVQAIVGSANERAGLDRVWETVLHEADGAFTPAIDAVLRQGAGLLRAR